MSYQDQIKEMTKGIKRPQNVSYPVWPEFAWLRKRFTKVRQWFDTKLNKTPDLPKPEIYSDLEWAVICCTAQTLRLPVDQVNLNTPIPSEFVRSITMDVCLLVNQPFIIRGLSSEQTVTSIVYAFISCQI